jgi:SAM-dependent methyltransferase
MKGARSRGPFEGVWHIVQFNWPFFIVALATMVALITFALLPAVPRLFAIAAIVAACAAAWLVAVSLFVSFWIYDCSRLCRWEWIRELLPQPRQAVNVHAGFDESSEALRELFPDSRLLVCDFYDPQKSPQPSIARARRAYPPAPDVQSISPTNWPLPEESCDAIFLLLAAHELRQRPDRIGFFREAHRVLAPTGRVVLVEHLRDLPNFLAFGPGFLHFLPRSEWLCMIEEGGFRIAREFSITPFVRVFILDPSC